MKITKGTVIVVASIIALLTIAFFAGGAVTNNEQPAETPVEELAVSASPTPTAEQPAEQPAEMPAELERATPEVKPTTTPSESPKPTEPRRVLPTAVAPAAEPAAQEAETTASAAEPLTCTLTVRCDTILSNMDKLKDGKQTLVPSDGVIFATKSVEFNEGESVFNVLQREMKRAKIHMEFNNVPMYNSAYIEGINNLYEFDVGELSGWEYKVNGVFPSFGCSQYKLKAKDEIVWLYTCDLGKDIGAGDKGGNRR